MFIIRKLVLKEWFKFFIGSVLILLIVLSLGQVLTGLLKASNELKSILLDLILEIPSFLIKIFPVSCLVASLFSINKLKSRNELAAIFASGFSRKHFILTIALAGTLVGSSLFVINGHLVPYTKQRQSTLADTHPSIANKAKTGSVSINALKSGRIWFKGLDYFFSYSSFDPINNIIYNLNLFYHDNQYKFTEHLSSLSAHYISENNWELKQGIHVNKLSGKSFPETQLFTSKNIQLREDVNDFKKINSDISTLDIWRLYDYISILRHNGVNESEYLVTFLDKFSSGLTCLVLAILASIALFNPNRRNSSFGMNIAFVLSFTFIYWFIYSYLITLGQISRIQEIWATFGVPFFFVLYLASYFIYHRKLR